MAKPYGFFMEYESLNPSKGSNLDKILNSFNQMDATTFQKLCVQYYAKCRAIQVAIQSSDSDHKIQGFINDKFREDMPVVYNIYNNKDFFYSLSASKELRALSAIFDRVHTWYEVSSNPVRKHVQVPCVKAYIFTTRRLYTNRVLPCDFILRSDEYLDALDKALEEVKSISSLAKEKYKAAKQAQIEAQKKKLLAELERLEVEVC